MKELEHFPSLGVTKLPNVASLACYCALFTALLSERAGVNDNKTGTKSKCSKKLTDANIGSY